MRDEGWRVGRWWEGGGGKGGKEEGGIRYID